MSDKNDTIKEKFQSAKDSIHPFLHHSWSMNEQTMNDIQRREPALIEHSVMMQPLILGYPIEVDSSMPDNIVIFNGELFARATFNINDD